MRLRLHKDSDTPRASFRVSVSKYATKDPNYRILARQRSRFTHYYFYLRDETLARW